MAYFPFFIDIENKNCLIVGGGEVAYRKAEAVLRFKANVTMISPKFSKALRTLSNENKKVTLLEREFCKTDLKNVLFVIAATDDRKINDNIYKLCSERNILVNVVDEKEQCSFFFPSIVKQNDIVVGICSGGKSPILSKKIRKKIEKAIPDYYGKLNDELGEMREQVKKSFDTLEERKKFYNSVINQREEKLNT